MVQLTLILEMGISELMSYDISWITIGVIFAGILYWIASAVFKNDSELAEVIAWFISSATIAALTFTRLLYHFVPNKYAIVYLVVCVLTLLILWVSDKHKHEKLIKTIWICNLGICIFLLLLIEVPKYIYPILIGTAQGGCCYYFIYKCWMYAVRAEKREKEKTKDESDSS